MTTQPPRTGRRAEPKAAHPFFDTEVDLQKLFEEQGIGIVTDFDALLGDFWPEDEPVDDFLEARQRWRTEGERA